MGQTIEINRTTVLDKVLLIDTDRTLAGQDGEAYGSVEAAGRSATFPARLAARMLAADPEIDHVFVMSNQVSVRRISGWGDESTDTMTRIVSEFFRVYPDRGA